MASSAPEGTGSDCKLRFDIYEVDPLSGELRKHGVRIPLEERPFRALLILLRRANALVTREELQQQLWPSDTFVDFDHGLNTAIRKIRLALNDHASAPRFIETVGRRGYRFLRVVEQGPEVASERTVAVAGAATTLAIAAPTAALEALSDSSSGAIAAIKATTFNNKWIWIAAVSAVLAVAAAIYLWWRIPPAIPLVEGVTQLSDDGEPKPDWGYLATDGSRVYFNEGVIGSLKVAQVAVTGGPTAFIPTTFGNPQIVGLSPEGSALFALVGVLMGGRERPAYPLWEIPLPAGEPRRFGSIEAQDADVSPDGRIVFARGPDLYVAEKDGSGSRRLVSVADDIFEPSVSPNGRRLVFTTYTPSSAIPRSIIEGNIDGSGLQPVLKASSGERLCCARWTPDGNYLLFRRMHEGRWDLWVYPANAGFFHFDRRPAPLTSGPLSYSGAIPSRDGKYILAIGAKQRGELVYYDTKSNQFLPFLSGISGFNVTVSRDGQWVAYTSYPAGNLWRSRADGSERLQLTFAPMRVEYPFISPDGKQVAFGNSDGETYVISMEGGAPQKVVEKVSRAANWSPDGKLLVFTRWIDSDHPELQILDLRSNKVSLLPSSQGLQGGQWVSQDVLVAAARRFTKGIVIFDFKTQTWSDLLPGDVGNWAHSLDYKYLYYTTTGTEPKVMRIRIADYKVETIASLKDLRRARGADGNTQISVAADGSAVFTRDVGTQEIYALRVKWP